MTRSISNTLRWFSLVILVVILILASARLSTAQAQSTYFSTSDYSSAAAFKTAVNSMYNSGCRAAFSVPTPAVKNSTTVELVCSPSNPFANATVLATGSYLTAGQLDAATNKLVAHGWIYSFQVQSPISAGQWVVFSK